MAFAEQRLAMLANVPLLDINDAVLEAAKDLLDSHIVPRKAADDAFHISCAAVHGADYLHTWNCKHIANPHLRSRIRECLHRHDADMPVICTPEEFLGGDIAGDS